MSPGERRLISFVADRLESILRRPSAWGSAESVEDQILQLLEMRRVLIDSTITPRDTQRLMQTYHAFITRELPQATAEPLAVQLQRAGRSRELSSLMRKFIEEELAIVVVEQRGDTTESEIAGATKVERAARIVSTMQAGILAKVRRQPAARNEAISFPSQERGE